VNSGVGNAMLIMSFQEDSSGCSGPVGHRGAPRDQEHIQRGCERLAGGCQLHAGLHREG
jgi:hypothetical protein